jgi:alpha-L-fucosidase
MKHSHQQTKNDRRDVPIPLASGTALATQEAAESIAWWREARFGMFIHWGLYSLLAGRWQGKLVRGIGEWIMYLGKIPLAEYSATANAFNPVNFDAEQWVRLAADAGMKYLVITAKHHDGFAMFQSEKPYNIVADTPFRRDPMKKLAAACHQHGIRLCFYYSQDLDWHAPGGGNHWDNVDEKGNQKPTEAKAFAHYLEDKVKPQLRELLTNYGPVGLIWFDVPATITKEQSLDLREFVHRLQPDCLVSGRVGHDCGDYGSLGDNQIPAGPLKGEWETPATFNDSWGFKADDHNWKTPEYLIQLLVQCASRGVNYLLNIGPDGKGVVPDPTVKRLEIIGKWLKTNGEAIYGSQRSPFPSDFAWGRVTAKRGHLYLHFLKWPGRHFALAGLHSRVHAVRLLADGRVIIRFRQEADPATGVTTLHLSLPEHAPDPLIPVIALDVEDVSAVDPLPVEQLDGQVLLPVHLAKQQGTVELTFQRAGWINNWKTADSRLHWSFRLQTPGRYRVFVQSILDRVSDLGFLEREGRPKFGNHRMRGATDGSATTGLAGRKDMIMDESVNRWHMAESDLGVVEFKQTGVVTLTLSLEEADAASEFGPTVVGIRLAGGDSARKVE